MKHKKYGAFFKTKKITDFVFCFLKKLCIFANHNKKNRTRHICALMYTNRDLLLY